MIPSTIKYIIWPGAIRSKNDGDTHFIGFHALARCYNVPINQCIDGSSRRVQEISAADRKRLIDLHPRFDGNYTIPKK